MHYVVLYAQNGDCVVTIDSVTSLTLCITMLCAAEPIVRGCSSDRSTGCRKTVVNGVTISECTCARSRCNHNVLATGGQSKAAYSAITYAAAAMFAVVVMRSA